MAKTSTLTPPPSATNGAAGEASPLPDCLGEPELSAFLQVHRRIADARRELSEAERGWALLLPILTHHYRLSDADQIAADGRILRAEDPAAPPSADA